MFGSYNNNEYFTYRIEINAIDYILPFLNLIYKIGVKSDSSITVFDIFNNKYYANLGLVNKEEDEINDFEKIIELSERINRLYFTFKETTKSESFLKYLFEKSQKQIIFYRKDTNVILTTFKKDKELRNHFNKLIKEFDPISKIIIEIEDNFLKEVANKIKEMFYSNNHLNFLTIKNTSDIEKPSLLSFPLEWIDASKIKEDENFDSIIINKEYNKLKPLLLDSSLDFSLIKDTTDKRILGVKFSSEILCEAELDYLSYINCEHTGAYIWKFFKKSIFNGNDEKADGNKNKLIELYDNNVSGFIEILKKLEHNLYLNENTKIPEEFKELFYELVFIENLHHLDNYKFFLQNQTTDNDNKGILAIYSGKKQKEEYNLLHYLDSNDRLKMLHYRDSSPKDFKGGENVYVLKPEYAFYLIENFFENILYDILHENLKLDFISNAILRNRQGHSISEYDFIVFKDNTFYIIEAKTSISKDTIYSEMKKLEVRYKKLQKYFDSSKEIKVELLLIGMLADQTIDGYLHLAKNDAHGYNKHESFSRTNPYFLEIPLIDKDFRIQCIIQPSKEKLTETLRKCIV